MKEIKNVKEGDIIVIHSNLSPELKKLPKPVKGEVVSVNGFYVKVKPLGFDWTQEFYKNEIRHLNKKENLSGEY